jgi:hypothetical protein
MNYPGFDYCLLMGRIVQLHYRHYSYKKRGENLEEETFLLVGALLASID